VLSGTPEGNSLSAAAKIGEITDAKAGHEGQWCEELNRFAVSIDFECVAPRQVLERGFPHEQSIAEVNKRTQQI
jgi:hypothetical protein